MRLFRRFPFLWHLLSALALSAVASAQTIVNAGFSTPTQTTTGYTYNPASADWTFLGQGGIAGKSSAWAPIGNATSQFAFLQVHTQDTNSISQSISFTTAGTFLLSYLEGGRESYPGLSYTVSVTSDGDNSVIFSTSDSNTTGAAFSYTSYWVTIPSTGNYTLKFEAVSGGVYTDRAVLFDDVAFTAIPEPAAWSAMVAGVAASYVLVLRPRRKREDVVAA